MTIDEFFNHTILWRRLDLPGHDICRFWKTTTDWQLSGTTIFQFDQMPCLLLYEVSINSNWQTCIAKISGYVGTSNIDLTIAPTHNKYWSINGVETRAAAGCIDLDLGFTPATNLIAICRLSLKVGERASAPAAWLDFPDFTLTRLVQQYHRISDTQYEYVSPDVGYEAVLEVNQYGAITHYPGLWEQEIS